jgi:5-methyltetrahydrofolate--homocysteine methyltransferase
MSSSLLAHLSRDVLLCDGGTGSRVQAMQLDIERDYWGKENCTEILVLSRPDLVRDIAYGYLAAGADIVQTNSFGGSPITLGEFELADSAMTINRRAAELAREACEQFIDGRPRYVLGSIGPGTKLPSLGHIEYDTLEASLTLQAEGLISGGVDGLLIETCQDPLQIKAAINASKIAREKHAQDIPIFVQVTIETTGTLLVGPDIAAVTTILEAMKVDLIGLNCATGPREMAEHVRWLGQNWPGLISVQPNAGLPELLDGKTHYPLTPQEMARWVERFVAEYGVALIGGCCGTNIAHISALDDMLRARAREQGRAHHRPAPLTRTVYWQAAVASLYSQTLLRQENSYFSIGERCNANGSKKWRELQAAHDWDGCVAMGKEQEREGSHALDICTAFVGRDEVGEMNAVITRMTGAVSAPLVIDSTEYPVLEQALKRYGGKAILNSINFEDGESPAAERLALARKFGASVIGLTIDEQGMAKTPDKKLEIARRLVDFACNRHGLAQADLLIDPLTFTIATGNEEDRKLGQWTLEGITAIRAEFPHVQIVLGLSNISFGLGAAARHVLNSVFLDEAIKAGMTASIVHVSKIKPLHQIPAEEVELALDLLYDRREEGYDPLARFLALFAERKTDTNSAPRQTPTSIEEQLKARIVDGNRKGLEQDLGTALERYSALDIINTLLLDGMKEVGELFGAGKMQLPFVLQSAETMKAAVAFLEPYMEKLEGQQKGTIVLATVKGDVHDIGKNLVDIILSNNGYRVLNLGIKQPIQAIIDAAQSAKADAIGMSGLLVKSTVVMRDNLLELNQAGIDLPVLLGGAALTRNYVEDNCVSAYQSGRVAYARDAFDGLMLMDKIMAGSFDNYLAALQTRRQGKATNQKRKLGLASQALAPEARLTQEQARARRMRLTGDIIPPTPPFWGARLLSATPLKTLVPFLNERSLYQFQWGFRKAGRSLEDFLVWARHELKPVLRRMLELVEAETILTPQAVYGYWPAAGDGDDVVLFDPAHLEKEVLRFTLPRQAKADGDGQSIADFLQDISAPKRDVLGLQVVTMGQRASEVARAWFDDNRYQDYLYLHGLSVEMAEAMAEYVHQRIRTELGFIADEAMDMEKLLQQGYRGSRYSFGYPACPRLEDQAPILALLGAERIGVTLSEEFQLEPEQSTSAIVVHHPQAKYFSV